MSYISDELEKFTAGNSGFETSRNYISISHCHESVDSMVDTFFKGFQDSHKIRLRCYKGYQIEHDMLRRLLSCFSSRIKTGIEISQFGGLVQGHPDFTFDSFPGDIKSVPADEHMPFHTEDKKIPARVYWQMQGYMFYMKKDKAIVIYESRETGIIRDYWIKSSPNVQKIIDEKFRVAVEIIEGSAKLTKPDQITETDRKESV